MTDASNKRTEDPTRGAAGPRAGVIVCALAFVLLFSYELTRTAIDSFFLEEYGSARLPWVWLTGVAAVGVSVGVYNRLARTWPLVRLLDTAVFVTVALVAALAVVCAVAPRPGIFLLYVWKDVHIVVLLEIVWSFANGVFSVDQAKRSYGIFCAVGSVAGILGAKSAAWLTPELGLRAAIWIPAVLIASASFFGHRLVRVIGSPKPIAVSVEATPEGATDGPEHVLRQSRYLGWLLALVALTQIAIPLVDFVYNQALEHGVTATERTEIMANVNSAISAGALILQLATPLILLRLGVPLTLRALPVVLGVVVTAGVLSPVLLLAAAAKVTSKAFDYSLFRASKETLYIPLSYAERVRGKAIIDMFGYRGAKGAASLLLLGLGAIGVGRSAIGIAILVVIAVWLAVAVRVTRRATEPQG